MKKNNNTNEQLASIEAGLTKTEQFIEDNSKSLSLLIGIIIAVFIGFFCYSNFYLKPLNESAQNELFIAEQYFEKNQFTEALEGTEEFDGLLSIIENYGNTKSGKLAKYYAGISYMNLGQFEEAIQTLEEYKSKDKLLLSIATMNIGDAFSELKQPIEAIEYYKKSLSITNNDLISPIILMKCAKKLEEQEDYESALNYYEKIKNIYPSSKAGLSIDQYISKINAKL